MRSAQAGGELAADDGVAEAAALAGAGPTVPCVDVPPVALKPDFMPLSKLDLTLAAARRSGDTAADPATCATPPIPDATPAGPDCPIDPRV
jgi:hypothetical protein